MRPYINSNELYLILDMIKLCEDKLNYQQYNTAKALINKLVPSNPITKPELSSKISIPDIKNNSLENVNWDSINSQLSISLNHSLKSTTIEDI